MSELAAFELVGGPGCGIKMGMALKPAGQTYLIEIPRAGDINGLRDVWAYRFANRSTPDGCWVLECERYVGFRGYEPPEVDSVQCSVFREEEEKTDTTSGEGGAA